MSKRTTLSHLQRDAVIGLLKVRLHPKKNGIFSYSTGWTDSRIAYEATTKLRFPCTDSLVRNIREVEFGLVRDPSKRKRSRKSKVENFVKGPDIGTILGITPERVASPKSDAPVAAIGNVKSKAPAYMAALNEIKDALKTLNASMISIDRRLCQVETAIGRHLKTDVGPRAFDAIGVLFPEGMPQR